MSFTQVNVTGQYLNPATGAARTGTITFTLSSALHNGGLTSATTFTASLASGGEFAIQLPATNDRGTTPAGPIYYQVAESLDGGAAGGTYALPVTVANAAAGIHLPLAAHPPNKPTVTGAKGANAALGSLMTALSGLGQVTDNTTA